MRFLLILLFYTSVVLSNPLSNIWARGVASLAKLNPSVPRDEPEAHQAGPVPKPRRSQQTRRDTPLYIARAADPEDDEATKKTREFLNSKVTDKNQEIIELTHEGHIRGWGRLTLDENGKKEVEEYTGIAKPLREEKHGKKGRAVSKRNAPKISQDIYSSFARRGAQVKRALTWKKQADAVKDLVMVSQYDGGDLSKMNDFVYEQKAGEGIYIYVLDEGVQLDVKNKDTSDNQEFPNTEKLSDGSRKVLITDTYKKKRGPNPVDPVVDDDIADSHGTMVASRALGKKYGVAKGATVIPVKVDIEYDDDFPKAIELIYKDIKANAGREKKSVVVSSLEFGDHETHAGAQNEIMKDYINDLFNLGVPVIVSAGNDGDDTSGTRKNIDALPQVLEDKDFPLINVGAVDYDGTSPVWSQKGTQLTIHAPGVKSECQTRDDGKTETEPGTSFAAPAVGGVIATYMAYDKVPWDDSKTGKARVQEIKDFIQKDESSRKHTGDIRSIWNGATKDAHSSVGANGLGATQQPWGPDNCPTDCTCSETAPPLCF